MKNKFTIGVFIAACLFFTVGQVKAECGIGTAASCEYIVVQEEQPVKYRIDYEDGIEVQRINVDEARKAEQNRPKIVSEQLDQLRTLYPNGYYWNHEITAENIGQTVNGTWIETWQNSVTSRPCNHDFDKVGKCGCNAFDHATACWGFANKVFYDVFGIRASTMEKRTDIENISVGDHVRFNYVHSAIVIARDGDKVTLLECNYNNRDCQIQWDRVDSIKNIIWYQHTDKVP